MDNDGLVLHITSFAVVPLCIIAGSPTVTTPRRVQKRKKNSKQPAKVGTQSTLRRSTRGVV